MLIGAVTNFYNELVNEIILSLHMIKMGCHRWYRYGSSQGNKQIVHSKTKVEQGKDGIWATGLFWFSGL